MVVPAEWQKQQCLYIGFPSDACLWPGGLFAKAQQEVAAFAKAVASTQQVFVVAHGQGLQNAQTLLAGVANIELCDLPLGDVWLRDTGPVFTASQRALRFLHNGWGGKYFYTHDDTIGDAIAAHAKAETNHFDYVLEGGALEHNGEGVLLTTKQCLLNPNRNAWDSKTAEVELFKAFKQNQTLWLDSGLLYDHTDGHIDNVARFIGANTILCQLPAASDDPQKGPLLAIHQQLLQTDFTIKTIVAPGKVCDSEGEIMPASYMNFVIANDVVVVPVYGTATQQQALAELQLLFPNKKVLGLPANALLTGGGAFHCISQQVPL